MKSEISSRLSAALADRYVIERELGAGGMAIVFLARDLKHNRSVALKVLRPELSAVLGADRFLNEIEVTASLQHPNILPLYDSGRVAGPIDLLYYVMPFVEGESLRARLDSLGSLSLEETAEIAKAVAAALEFAHARGVVHRDVKPENILFQGGQAIVADFGIALALAGADSTRLTETGLSIGTPSYMSPEQFAGDRAVDYRTDIYALGSIVYEALAGKPPFTGETVQAVLAQVITEAPRPIRSLRPAVPRRIEAVLQRALAKSPADRQQSARELAQALADATTAPAATRGPVRVRRLLAGVAALAVVALGFAGYRAYRRMADRQWVLSVAIPEIERLAGEARFADAFGLATAAFQRLPHDSTVRALLERSSMPVDVTSEPAGARVSFRGYTATDSAWFEAGTTPLTDVRMPYGMARVRFSLPGFHPLEVGLLTVFGRVSARLTPVDEAGPMVWVPAGEYHLTGETVALDAYWLDRHEVSNGEYQTFVDDGGYDEPDHWRVPFVRSGHVVPRDTAMASFVDATGRPGPASWELSRHPDGRADLPVSGVSWYEAAAYCRYAGKSLPTYYHWRYASGLEIGPWDDVLTLSNFGRTDVVPVESMAGVGPYGTFDMAGNVREWVWNESRGLRHVLGGAWTDPEYLFINGDAADPWSRAPTNGFRCARYESPPDSGLLAPIEAPHFDFRTVEPVDDATYAIYRKFYEYAPTDLDARVLSADTTAEWIKQHVDFTAAYGDERVSAYVFLPRRGKPPFQTVVYFPGSAAFRIRSSANLAEMALVGFVPRSGRALVYPVYKGTYERFLDPPPAGLPGQRQIMIWRTQDLLRSVDYVTAREDLRTDALGYLGLSLGAEIAVPVALEKRFAALVLVGGAYDPVWWNAVPPEAAPWNFAPHITTPTMLINGRRDFMHHYETGQVPFFQALDVPDGDKEFVLLESGHVPAWNDVVRNALRWYDLYLGPVR